MTDSKRTNQKWNETYIVFIPEPTHVHTILISNHMSIVSNVVRLVQVR